MRYLKKFNEDVSSELKSICLNYGIKDFHIQDDFINVDGDVDLRYKNLTKLPLNFGIVYGNFDCSSNRLETLEGSPRRVDGNFDCQYNRLESLKGIPDFIGGYLRCSHNNLESLEFLPKSVEHCVISGNNIKVIEFDQIINLKSLKYSENPIYNIIELFRYPDDGYNSNDPFYRFRASLEWNYLRHPNKIIFNNFREACLDEGIKIPESIKGYEFI